MLIPVWLEFTLQFYGSVYDIGGLRVQRVVKGGLWTHLRREGSEGSKGSEGSEGMVSPFRAMSFIIPLRGIKTIQPR